MTIHHQNPDPKIIQSLKDQSISYTLLEHSPFFSCQDSESFWSNRIQSSSQTIANCKTLMLRDKKKKNYYMYITFCDQKVDLSQFQNDIDSKRLSFASESDLESLLQVYPGCVNPFSLIHDQENMIHVYIHKETLKFDLQAFHPGNNKYSIELTTQDFQNFLSNTGNKVTIL